ncbi:MAG: CaiB/BaiF CoA transferase family protein [Acidimicrobiales bacterium]
MVEVAPGGSGGVAGAWCARLLGQLGAQVILVEPPGGSPLRRRPPLLPGGGSPWHHWLHADKLSVVAADDDEVDRWVAAADCVIRTVAGDEETATVAAWAAGLRRHRPRQVVAALSPFGLTGPWRGLASSELTEWAAGGHLQLTGAADEPPVQGGGPWPAYFTGTNAAIGILAALFDAGRTGEGQLVDVGAMETMAGSHQWTITAYTHHGYVKRRDGNRLAESYHPMGMYRCREGWVQLAVASAAQWEALCITTGAVELLADDELLVPAGRYDRADDIDAAIIPWFAERTATEAVAELQESRIPASLVNDLPEVLHDEQLAARRFWSPVPDLGPAARVPGPGFQIGGREAAKPVSAPVLDGDRRRAEKALAAAGVLLPDVDLRGVRVLEFSIAWAGPLTGRYLADLGADVIKVEHPTARGLGVVPGGVAEGWRWGELPPASVRNGTWPSTDPGERWFNRMGLFNKLQRNKRSLCLDVKAPGGTELLHRLVERSDIVLNNYSPRGVTSLGIDHDSLSAVNERIITVSMSGYGATGPMASHFSFGPILETHAGLASTTGHPGGGPFRIGVAFPDPFAGHLGSVAALAALWERQRTGVGTHVDLSQLEGLLCLVGDQLLTTSVVGRQPGRLGNRSSVVAPQGVYPCGGDDAWIAITVRSDDEWERLARMVNPEALDVAAHRHAEGRRRHHDTIDGVLSAWTTARGKFEVQAALQSIGVPALAVLTSADLVDGPQLASRSFIATIRSGDAGPQRLPGSSLHFSRREVPLGPAPTLGQHNHAIAVDLLGYDPEAVARLECDGTLATSPPG